MSTTEAKANLPRVPVTKILDTLYEMYPDAHCELDFRNPFELLIATILSAQATDKKVNQITATLFQKYPDPESFLALSQEALEQEIKEIGLYKNKAKNILATCHLLLTHHGGQVPAKMEQLVELPGVGRKTANVVLSNAFGIPAMAVDTHVLRVSNRIGLAQSDDPVVIEKQLTKRIPKAKWTDAHHWLIWHGRRVCDARKPKCEQCALTPFCREFKARKKTRVE
ncbi:endonuclease III [Tumebacillus algifaecis]|uniref:Endonuclease III n=1 Tax=Tumebacillus algifaecis TaxID=1214604 RepID=A0A223CYW4_9BACL|nr:endonuclease III [Tumebacillus algifaecis]ASS74455.1 endonuclease III [Tumebacillus algifaecis]